MAQAIPFIAKMVAGAVVSKAVGKITGEPLLGALAGGFVGMGLGFDPQTGFSWEGFGAEATAGAGGAASMAGDVVSGGEGLLTSGLDLGTVGAIDGVGTVGGIDAIGTVSGGASSAAGGLSESFLSGIDLGTVGGVTAATPAGIAAGAATPPGGGFLDNALSFVKDNKELVNIGAKGISGLMAPDEEDLLRAKYGAAADAELEILREKERLKDQSAVDPDKASFRPAVEAVQQGGYKPQIQQINTAGYQPTYITRQNPNLRRLYSRLGVTNQEETS